MTKNRKLQRAVRERMRETGESYMEVHRQLSKNENDSEPYYLLSHRHGVVRVEGRKQWNVPRPTDGPWMVEESGAWWGYCGCGPITTAKFLLDDACAAAADLMEAREFAGEVLARLDAEASEDRLTVGEVRAWWSERRHVAVAKARARANADGIISPEAQRKELERLLNGPPSEGLIWLKRRREAHPPRF